MKLAFLYAGQGSQHAGMGRDMYDSNADFRAAFDAAKLDFDLKSVCFDDPDGVINLTQYNPALHGGICCGHDRSFLRQRASVLSMPPACRWANTPP